MPAVPPDPQLISALGSGANMQAGLMSQGINIISEMAMNRQMRRWNEKMYGLQRQHALQDWAMQNEYNHPSSQMARLREAGLNPNLIYGKGADVTAGPIRSSSNQSWNPKAPKVDLQSLMGSAVSGYFDANIKQAQADNLRTQNTVLEEEKRLKQAQVVATLIGAGKTETDWRTGVFDLELKKDLRETSLEAAKQALEKMKAETKYTLTQEETAAVMRQPNLTKALEEIFTIRLKRAETQAQIDHIRQQIINLKKDEKLKQLDIDLREMGVMPGDPIYFRVLGRLLGGGRVSDLFPSRTSGLGKHLGSMTK